MEHTEGRADLSIAAGPAPTAPAIAYPSATLSPASAPLDRSTVIRPGLAESRQATSDT